MGLAVVTVAAGGLPVAAGTTGAMAVTEAAKGLAVTKVIGRPGLPVTYVTAAGVVVPILTPTAFNPADKVQINLSNSNLTGTSTLQGGVRTVASFPTGKYYWEYLLSTFTHAASGVGICTAAATLSNVGLSPVGAAVVYPSGAIWINNANSGATLGARSNGDVVGIAVDFTARLSWMRVTPAGNWNGSGTANPATGVGGGNISALTGALFPLFASGNVAGQVVTANFGGSAFAGAVPAGFTAGAML